MFSAQESKENNEVVIFGRQKKMVIRNSAKNNSFLPSNFVIFIIKNNCYSSAKDVYFIAVKFCHFCNCKKEK